MRVLVACEVSGKTRRLFRERGHHAWSCDLLPAEDNSRYHIQGDVLDILHRKWDLMIAHPPCQYLAVSGNRWHKDSPLREQALHFVAALMNASISKWCIENPVSVISGRIRPPDQIIEPWQFGHPETKRTCLWLHGLPPLKPTNVVKPTRQRIWMMGELPDRARFRSRTYDGIAQAFAEQWG